MDDLVLQSNYSQALGFRLVDSGDGRARIACVLRTEHMNTRKVCHGGVISGLMDMAAGVATKSQLDDPHTRNVATVSLTVNYQRPGHLGEELVAEAHVLSGRRIVTCEVAVTTLEGTPVAVGLATLNVR